MNGDRTLRSNLLKAARAALRLLVGGAAIPLAVSPRLAVAAGDPLQGAQAFRYCAACHSIEEGRNLTGPSLAGVLGRKAGSLPSFRRYSDALKRSGIVWSEHTLDAWIANSAALVPGNEMRFPGIGDAQVRNNLVAYLKAVAEGKGRALAQQVGMNFGNGLPNLKEADAQAQVRTIRYCDDTYVVTTAAGRTLKFWEFNLRFKTDSSNRGPRQGVPVLVGQGMQGDRAQVVFADPGEIATLVKSECPK